MIIDRIQATLAKEGRQRIIYLGDGIGDFCPSLKLRDEDFMMPRKDFPVWGLICENRALLRAEIHEWIDGEDMEKIVMKLIEKIKIQDSVQLLSTDLKFETMPIALPQSVKVQQ